jgi:biotin carboxyl carrier protein
MAISLSKTMSEYKYKINGNPYTVAVGEVEDGKVTVEVNGTAYNVELEEQPKEAPKAAVARPATSAVAPKAAAAGKKSEKSPLPGVIVGIKVKVGDVVKKGDTLIILEAMKMENNFPSTAGGTIAAINVANGDSVMEGADLITYE